MERDELDQFLDDNANDAQTAKPRKGFSGFFKREQQPEGFEPREGFNPQGYSSDGYAQDEYSQGEYAPQPGFNSGGQFNIITLMDFLTGELNGASSVPLTNKKLVDADKCTSIINDIRASLPDAILHANSMLRNRDAILEGAEGRAADLVNGAQAQSQSIIDNANRTAKEAIQAAHQQATAIRQDAETRATVLVGVTTITQRAESEAREAMGDARKKANQISADALKYTVDILGELKKVLSEQLDNVNENLQNLMPDQSQPRR